METHPRKKIDVLVDGPLARKVTRLIDDAGVKGYSVFRSIGGRGEDGTWREDQLTGAQQKVLIQMVLKPETADRILEELGPQLDRYSAILYVSDVTVLRAEKF
ncbi:MAG: DUF190 domain-containing protein [Alphaproteobacteria bacterium]|nr:DUF190 domain-containing protein [Alphaproteobacteria bacterium]